MSSVGRGMPIVIRLWRIGACMISSTIMLYILCCVTFVTYTPCCNSVSFCQRNIQSRFPLENLAWEFRRILCVCVCVLVCVRQPNEWCFCWQLLCQVLNRVSSQAGCFQHVVTLNIPDLETVDHFPILTAVVGVMLALLRDDIQKFDG